MKLLTYSSKKYVGQSLLLVVLSIPISYLLLNFLFLKTIDQKLENRASSVKSLSREIQTPEDLDLWKKVDKDIQISHFNPSAFREDFFDAERNNPETNEIESYRSLQKQAEILGIKHSVTFQSSLKEKNRILATVLIVQVFLLVLLLIGFILIHKQVMKKTWLPFHTILGFLKHYEFTKEKEFPVESFEIDEFNDLKSEIENVIQRGNTAYRLQKEFTENAAHELQTPVAIIKSKLDLLLQEENLSGSQSALIDQIYYVLQKLSDLNKNLLFLSKIENQQFEFEDEIDVIKTIDSTVDNLSFFAEAKYQQLIFPRPQQKELIGNQALFDQLIQNLLINAIQYSPKGSLINIVLDADSLEIINEGPRMAFDEEKLFSRFSKTIEKNQKGNGLGLAICKKIVDVHQLNIRYEYLNSKHHFIIDFKQPD